MKPRFVIGLSKSRAYVTCDVIAVYPEGSVDVGNKSKGRATIVREPGLEKDALLLATRYFGSGLKIPVREIGAVANVVAGAARRELEHVGEVAVDVRLMSLAAWSGQGVSLVFEAGLAGGFLDLFLVSVAGVDMLVATKILELLSSEKMSHPLPASSLYAWAAYGFTPAFEGLFQLQKACCLQWREGHLVVGKKYLPIVRLAFERCSALELCDPDGVFAHPQCLRTAKPTSSTTSLFKGDLMPHQQEVVSFCLGRAEVGVHEGRGGIVADEMGAGKTVSMVAYLCERSQLPGNVVVVAPASVVPVWMDHLRRFAPDLAERSVVLDGDERARESKLQAPGKEVFVMSYGVFARDATRIKKAIAERGGLRDAIFDEVHHLKNPASKAARTARDFCGHEAAVFGLSGTPLINSAEDVQSILAVCVPGWISPAASKAISGPSKRYGCPVSAKALSLLLDPVTIRHLSREVIDRLPAHHEVYLPVQLGFEQRAAYELLRKDLLRTLNEMGEEEFVKRRMQVLEKITRLRQCISLPSLVPGVEGDMSAKVDAVVEIVGHSFESGRKAVVYAIHKEFMHRLKEAIGEELGVDALVINGDTPVARREEMVGDFESGKGSPVLIMGLKSASEGLTLVSASVVVQAELWWQPFAHRQASARLVRPGQKEEVHTYYLVAEDTVDEFLLPKQESKQELSDALIGSSGHRDLKSMSRAELLAAFGGDE